VLDQPLGQFRVLPERLRRQRVLRQPPPGRLWREVGSAPISRAEAAGMGSAKGQPGAVQAGARRLTRSGCSTASSCAVFAARGNIGEVDRNHAIA